MAKSDNNSCQRVEGIDYISGIPLSIDISGGYIADISFEKSMDSSDLPFIAPGLFDIQVNGINGTDFNTCPLSYNDIRTALVAHHRHGITSFFPTLVTSDRKI